MQLLPSEDLDFEEEEAGVPVPVPVLVSVLRVWTHIHSPSTMNWQDLHPQEKPGVASTATTGHKICQWPMTLLDLLLSCLPTQEDPNAPPTLPPNPHEEDPSLDEDPPLTITPTLTQPPPDTDPHPGKQKNPILLQETPDDPPNNPPEEPTPKELLLYDERLPPLPVSTIPSRTTILLTPSNHSNWSLILKEAKHDVSLEPFHPSMYTMAAFLLPHSDCPLPEDSVAVIPPMEEEDTDCPIISKQWHHPPTPLPSPHLHRLAKC
jgi:hypothetical protein